MITLAIDFGTTMIRTAVFRRGNTEVIIEDGQIPSFVYLDKELKFGRAAEVKLLTKKNQVIWDVKRLVGLRATDPDVIDYCNRHGMKAGGDNYSLKLIIKGLDRTYEFSVQGIITEFLKYVIERAQEKLDEPIDSLCLTYPPAWNENQKREFYGYAQQIAGIKHIQLVSETVASCLMGPYGLTENAQYIILIDGGGGTFDVTIMKLSLVGGYEVLYTNGVPVGGVTFTNHIQDLIVQSIYINIGENARITPSVMNKIRTTSEEVKTRLNVESSVSDSIEVGSEIVYFVITGHRFGIQARADLHRCEEVILDALKFVKDKNITLSGVQLCGKGIQFAPLQATIKKCMDVSECGFQSNTVVRGAALFMEMDGFKSRHVEGDNCMGN